MVKSKPDKQNKSVCMLDLLHIKPPLAQSCFSETQIEMLFDLWKEFMFNRFKAGLGEKEAHREVNTLFHNNLSVGKKYTILRLDARSGVDQTNSAIPVTEVDWVMGTENPTPFVDYLQSNVELMYELRMGFKPTLNHSGMIDETDLLNVLSRYTYWLSDDKNKSINVIGVIDEYLGNSVNNAVQGLNTNWSDTRFHVALLSDQEKWRCVLVDRKQKTFEYYDPEGQTLNIKDQTSVLSVQVNKVYEAVKIRMTDVTTRLITEDSKTAEKTFDHHSSKKTYCGMYILLFIHYRVIMTETFEKIITSRWQEHQCDKLKNMFFHVPPTSNLAKITGVGKYPDYDIRLAGLMFTEYINRFKNMSTDTSQKQALQLDVDSMVELIHHPGDHNSIRIHGVRVNIDLLQNLGEAFQSYFQSDIWYQIISEIVNDPFTVFLRKVKPKGRGNSRKNIRGNQTLNIYYEIIKWVTNESVRDEMNVFVRQWVNTMVHILHFDYDNKSTYVQNMDITDFIRLTSAKVETVSFTVFILREINDKLQTLVAQSIPSGLSDYPWSQSILKEVSMSNLGEIQSLISFCDQTLEEASELLISSFTEQVSAKPFSLPKQRNTESDTVSKILLLNEKHFADGDFLHKPQIEGYSFPVNYEETESKFDLPERFRTYTVNRSDMQKLLANPTFFLYYTMGILLLINEINNTVSNAIDTIRHSLSAVFTSVQQFITVAQDEPRKKHVLCTLLFELKQSTAQNTVVRNVLLQQNNIDRLLTVCNHNVNDEDYIQFKSAVWQAYHNLKKKLGINIG